MEQELTNREMRIQGLLMQKFAPVILEIVDDSGKHAGHAGSSGAGETHFSIRIAAESLNGLGRVHAHRAINDALKTEFDTGLHALSIRILPLPEA